MEVDLSLGAGLVDPGRVFATTIRSLMANASDWSCVT